jgi:hypothetical protein
MGWDLEATLRAPSPRVLEGQPVILYGHSATVDGYNTPGAKWFQRVQRRLGLGPVLSRATGGFDTFEVMDRVFGIVKPMYSWIPGTKSIVILNAGGNEQLQGAAHAQLLTHMINSIHTILAWLSTGTFVHINDMTRVGTWTEITSYLGVPQGKYRYTTTAGETATASVTGPVVNVFYNTWDGTAVQGRHLEVRIDSVLLATIDTETAATTAEWGTTLLGGGVGCATFRGLSGGAHTVECRASATIGGGVGTPAATGVIGVSSESTTPPIIVVAADARVLGGADVTEYNAIFGAIEDAVQNFNGTHVLLVEANIGAPGAEAIGADGVHGNDIWERHMANVIEESLLTVDELPYLGTPGSLLPGMGETITTFSFPGAVTAGVGALKLTVPKSFVMLGAWAYVNTAPTGATMIVDVNRNGTTVYTNTAHRPTIAVSTNAAPYPQVPYVTSGGFNYPVVFDSGDILSIDVDQVGSTIAGSDLTVVVEGIYR